MEIKGRTSLTRNNHRLKKKLNPKAMVPMTKKNREMNNRSVNQRIAISQQQ